MRILTIVLSTLLATTCSAGEFEDLEKSCQLNNAPACIEIAGRYYIGEEVEQSDAKAVEYFSKGCELKDARGCNFVGLMYRNGDDGLEQSYAKAAEYYAKGCELENGDSCYLLASSYANGQGVEQSYQKAAEYYNKSCSLNNGHSCSDLGLMYANGQGLVKSIPKAIENFQKGCKLNSIEACLNLGNTASGLFSLQAYQVRAFMKACELNSGEGCDKAGHCFGQGFVGDQELSGSYEPEKAIAYYKKS